MSTAGDLDTAGDGPLVYDPTVVFAALFSDGVLARQVGPLLTCGEVNVLIGVLEAGRRDDASAAWLAAHQMTCAEPSSH